MVVGTVVRKLNKIPHDYTDLVQNYTNNPANHELHQLHELKEKINLGYNMNRVN